MRQLKFTLVELLVTIAVIAVLAGLLFPAFAKARATAQRASCASNLHGIGTAMKMYMGDYHDYLPDAAMMPSVTPDSPRIGDVLVQNLPAGNILRCPSDPDGKYFKAEGSSYAYNSSLGGQRLQDTHAYTHHGSEALVPLMYDFEPFHGKANTSGSCNYLFADGHVGDAQ